jgi:hypothetical protein
MPSFAQVQAMMLAAKQSQAGPQPYVEFDIRAGTVIDQLPASNALVVAKTDGRAYSTRLDANGSGVLRAPWNRDELWSFQVIEVPRTMETGCFQFRTPTPGRYDFTDGIELARVGRRRPGDIPACPQPRPIPVPIPGPIPIPGGGLFGGRVPDQLTAAILRATPPARPPAVLGPGQTTIMSAQNKWYVRRGAPDPQGGYFYNVRLLDQRPGGSACAPFYPGESLRSFDEASLIRGGSLWGWRGWLLRGGMGIGGAKVFIKAIWDDSQGHHEGGEMVESFQTPPERPDYAWLNGMLDFSIFGPAPDFIGAPRISWITQADAARGLIEQESLRTCIIRSQRPQPIPVPGPIPLPIG